MLRREPLESRTNEKLEYAKLMLDELKRLNTWDRSAFARAHEEAVLYHVAGVVDAFLQEINDAYHAGLDMDKVSLKTLSRKLKTGTSPALDAIRRLNRRPKGRAWKWLAVASSLRHHGTHRARPPVTYFEGGSEHGKVKYHNPNPRARPRETEQSIPDFLDFVVSEAGNLVLRLRHTLP